MYSLSPCLHGPTFSPCLAGATFGDLLLTWCHSPCLHDATLPLLNHSLDFHRFPAQHILRKLSIGQSHLRDGVAKQSLQSDLIGLSDASSTLEAMPKAVWSELVVRSSLVKPAAEAVDRCGDVLLLT